jgi:TonB family protein
VRVGGQVSPPRKIIDVKPIYPAEAQQKRISGIVILDATLGVDGRVSDVRVVRSVPALDEAAKEAVRGWQFTPTLIDGVPTPIIMSVTVSFTLNSNVPPPGRLETQAMQQGGGVAPAPTRSSGALPAYPSKQKDGVRGVVRLRVTVDEKGRVREVRSLSDVRDGTGEPLGKSFVDASTKAVKKWSYEPPARSPVVYDVQLRFVPGQEAQIMTGGRGAIPR